MGVFRTKKSDFVQTTVKGKKYDVLKKEKWEEFNSSILGLGDLGQNSSITSAICAVFDLEGFTAFCKQIDPQLAVPIFMKQFLNWFFQEIKIETKELETGDGIKTWHELPIMMKFLGDGILVIWDTEGVSIIAQRNIITSCKIICGKYVKSFYPTISKKVSDPPAKLRCGIAKGNIFSVGNGNDFVGPCINFASRLQKLPGTSLAFSNRGFNVEEGWDEDQLKAWVIKKIKVRGIGESELVHILKTDFEKMSAEDKKNFIDP